MSKLGVMRAENPLNIITANDKPKENPFKVELNNLRRQSLGIDNNYSLNGGMFGNRTPWDSNPLG